MNTVTVGVAGRNLPGVRPVEEELTPAQTKTYLEGIRRKDQPAQAKGFLEQGIEAGTALGEIVGGVDPNAAVKSGEEVGTHNPISADEREASRKLEKSVKEGTELVNGAEKAVESAGEWTSELSGLLSKESLLRFGKIIAGGLLLMFALVLFIKIMGGPSVIPIPV